MHSYLKLLGAGAVLTLLLATSDIANAQTFPNPPTNDAPFWIPMTRTGNSIADAVNGNADQRDIVGDTTHSAAYIASDANFLYLRIRLNGSPGTVGNIANNHGIGCLIDTDGTLTTYELALILDGNGTDAIKFDWNSTAGTANTSANPAETNLATVTSSATNTAISVASDTTFSNNADSFVDFAFSWTTFRTKVGASPTITSATALRFVCGTSVLPTNANELESDIFDGAAAVTLSASWSDAYTCNNGANPRCVTATDPDGDGIQNSVETTLGTSGTNFDSDGDTIPDWFEVRAVTANSDTALSKVDTDSDTTIDALDLDSDNDCTPDKTEGLATYRNAALPNANKNLACTSTPTKSICNPNNGACSACSGDNGSGQLLACPTTTSPICQASGACAVCSPGEPSACTTAAQPACESTTGQCAACNGDHGSAATAVCPTTTTPVCTAGACHECSATNLALCTSPAFPSCAADTGACSVCTGDNGVATNAPCPTGAAPACNLAGAFIGRCTVCSATNTTLCPSSKPACDPGGAVCTKCDGDRGTGSVLQCPNADAPLCVLTGANQGSCIKCATSADCGTGHAGPTCDTTTGQCVDIDPDKDGIQDAQELLLGTDPLNPDSDNDGILDPVEVTPVGGAPGAYAKVDTDNDGTIDALDTDSDGDTVLDSVEGGVHGDAGTLTDTDGDGTPDFRDIDDDQDAIATLSEITDATTSKVDDDVDSDGKKNWVDSDANGNGVKDGQDGRGDNDGDGILNYLDLTPDGEIITPVPDAGSADAGASSSSSSSSGFVSTGPSGDAGSSSGDNAVLEDGVIEGSGGCNESGGPMSSLFLGAGVIALALAARRRRK